MTSDKPTIDIDILMAFYGDLDLAQQAVASVRSQTDPGWRLIVLDDANPDPSLGPWLAALKDPRISYTRAPVNGGVNASFSRLLSMSTAELVTFLGCDDLLLPTYVEHMKNSAARLPAATIFHSGVEVIDEHGVLTQSMTERVKAVLRPQVQPGVTRLLEGERLAVGLLHGNWTYFPSICWRRQPTATVGFPAALEVVLDLSLLLELVHKGAILALDDTPVFRYRRHRASASSSGARDASRFHEEAAVFDEFAKTFRREGWSAAAWAARLRVSSRLHAASVLLKTRWRSDAGTTRRLVRHTVM